jgi:hypothetical protein
VTAKLICGIIKKPLRTIYSCLFRGISAAATIWVTKGQSTYKLAEVTVNGKKTG